MKRIFKDRECRSYAEAEGWLEAMQAAGWQPVRIRRLPCRVYQARVCKEVYFGR